MALNIIIANGLSVHISTQLDHWNVALPITAYLLNLVQSLEPKRVSKHIICILCNRYASHSFDVLDLMLSLEMALVLKLLYYSCVKVLQDLIGHFYRSIAINKIDNNLISLFQVSETVKCLIYTLLKTLLKWAIGFKWITIHIA